VINLAARVMGLVDGNQIALTDNAYSQLIDMADDPNMADRFREYANARIKHDVHITIHQYVNPDDTFLNSEVPEELAATIEAQSILERVEAQKIFELPGLAFEDLRNPKARLEALRMVESLGMLLTRADKFAREISGVDPVTMMLNMQKAAAESKAAEGKAADSKLIEGSSTEASSGDQTEDDGS
jgi:hypothetical protein